jgi:hypothetical protein
MFSATIPSKATFEPQKGQFIMLGCSLLMFKGAPQFGQFMLVVCKFTHPFLKDFPVSLVQANGERYLRVGGRGFCLGAGKTRSQKNA